MRLTFGIATRLLSLALILSSCFAQAQDCADAQKKFDAITDKSSYLQPSPWTQVQTVFGAPTRVEETTYGTTILHYSYTGCSIKFFVSDGRVSAKSYTLGAAAIVSDTVKPAESPRTTSTELAAAIVSLQKTANQLRDQLNQLDRAIQQLRATSTAVQTQPPAGLPAPPAVVAASPAVAPATAAAPVSKPLCAENGSCYGDISDATGRPKTVNVQGYYRKDGTYVRGYYRSTPSSSGSKK